jgi:hypothetical protein
MSPNLSMAMLYWIPSFLVALATLDTVLAKEYFE